MPLAPDVALPIFALLICIGLIIAIVANRQMREKRPQLLFAHLILVILWNVSLAWPADQRPLLVRWGTVMASAWLGIVFWAMAALERVPVSRLKWILAGGFGLTWAMPVLALVAHWLHWGFALPDQTQTFQGLAGLIWLMFAQDTVVSTIRLPAAARAQALRTWGIAFIANGLSIASLLGTWPPAFLMAPLWGAVGAVMTAIAVLMPSLADIRSILSHVLVYVSVTVLTGSLFVSLLLVAQYIFPGSALLMVAIIAAGTLGMVYQLLHRLITDTVDRILGQRVDRTRYEARLRDYGKTVRNILDPEQLAEAIMLIIHDTLGIDKGVLLVSDSGDDIGNVKFQSAGGLGVGEIEPATFRAFSPFMDDLRRKGIVLTLDALKSDPRFLSMREQEMKWLLALGVYLFVPVRARGQLVGILGLGNKNHHAFRTDEIEFLLELADRSGYPLENARLFSDMRTLNAVLNRLYTDLDLVNRRLKDMDKLKSAFISVVTHELRSPLVGIDFSLQLLQRQGLHRLSDEQREPIQDIIKGFAQMKGMIDKLVTFTSFLSKQGELRKEELDMVALIRQAVEPLQVMAQFRGIAIEVLIADNVPHLWADQERLSEAIYHLVHNAIKFTEPFTEPITDLSTQSQGRVMVSCTADHQWVSLTVSDNGIGIDADKLESIWDGFSQVVDPLRRGVEGLGLGLALVKYVANAHGGQVWAQSQIGRGSTFGFRIPISRAPGSTEQEMTLLMSDGRLSWGQ